ncbi:MAG: glycosyltransferase family 2 protein [Deltaproteobacteria bacterium]|nr:glycosyltransferase family 2 protein [Deltaproteobacteria bacterium]
MKVSVTIITLNEEANIRRCLESVRWADEIIVSDSGSVDKTVSICREYGARVYEDAWRGYGKQKNLCAGRAKNEWILNVDADEQITPELKDELQRAVEDGAKAGCYVARKNYFGARWIRHCGWYPDYNLRLYRKDKGSFNEARVHEAVTVDGLTSRLKNPLVHRTYRDITDYFTRMQRYSTLAAEELKDKGKRAGVADILLRPPLTFLKMYILKLGFLDGAMGLTLSMLYACYTLAKYAKLREMQ